VNSQASEVSSSNSEASVVSSVEPASRTSNSQASEVSSSNSEASVVSSVEPASRTSNSQASRKQVDWLKLQTSRLQERSDSLIIEASLTKASS
jgi:hypothetical protein